MQRSSLTAWTTRVSNPIRYPCFSTSVSVIPQKVAFALSRLLNIVRFHLYI